jgi:type IV pilus assembly protein PilW
MLNIKHKKLGAYHSAGFSLIELMVAMVIGLIIMAGVMSLYLTTRDTQRSSEDQLALLGDARFAIETIAYDLRHAGIWGETNEWKMIACHKDSELPCDTAMPAATADCVASEFINFKAPLSGSDGTNPFTSTCATKSYKTATDVLGIRYADSNRIVTADLAGSIAYVRSNVKNGQVFMGSTVPSANLYKWDNDAVTHNHLLVSRAYYVSTYTDSIGDGLPSLHRVSLITGPAMDDEMLLPGVEDFQLEFGIDTDSDMQVNAYVNANNVPDWTNGSVQAVKIWVLVRSQRVDRDNISSAQTFTIASDTPVTYPNDGYRRMLVSSVVKLRNMSRIDLQ